LIMKLVQDQLYFNNILESLKYKLYFKGSQLYLRCSVRLVLEDASLAPFMKASVNFGPQLQEYNETNFSNSFMLANVYDEETNLLNYEINIPIKIAFNNLWMTTKLSMYGEFQVFEEQIFDMGGVLQVTNFIDTRIVHTFDKNIDSPEMTEMEMAQEAYQQSLASTYGKKYGGPLYYSFCDPPRELKLMFGVNFDTFILENSYIPQLSADQKFKDYLKTGFIKNIKTTLYDGNFSYDVPSAETINSFEMGFSNIINGSLEIETLQFTSDLLKCQTTIWYEEPIQKFLNTILIPALQNELKTLYSTVGYASSDSNIGSLNYSQIENTLFYGTLILFSQKNNLSIVANDANLIYCDQELLGALIKVNQKLQDHFKGLLASDPVSSSIYPELQIDFDEMIEVLPKNKYVSVIPIEKTEFGLPTINKNDFASIAEDNIFKYFDSTTAQVGPSTYNLVPMSYGCFPARMFKLNGKKYENYFNFMKSKLTSKEIYDYYNILLKIIEINSEQEIKLAKKVNLDGISYEQYLAQEQSRQLAFMLDSLIIVAQSIDPAEEVAQANVFSTSIDVDVVKLPASLKTNLCLDSDTTEESSVYIDIADLNVTNALPASLLAPIVAKDVQPINETSLYNFKSVFSDRGALTKLEETNKLAVPLVFAAQSYINEGALKGFAADEPVLNNFINFGLLYLMIKCLFRIQYLDVDTGHFKDLDGISFADNLETKSRDLLCRVSPYKSGQLGVSQPKLLTLPIYSRHFVIKK